MPRRLVLIAMILVGSVGAWATNERVLNGGFESGSLSPWSTDKCDTDCTAGWSVVQGVGHTGNYGAEVTGANDIMQFLPPYNGVNPGVFSLLVTSASLWFKTAAPVFDIELIYSPPPGGPAYAPDEILEFPIDGDWHDYGSDIYNELQSPTSPGYGKFLKEIEIGSFGYNGGTQPVSYLDDVSIMANPSFNIPATPEPTSMLLLGSGLLSLLGRRAVNRMRH